MKINIQSNEFKILMFCLTAIVAVISVLPEMTYAEDIADVSTVYDSEQADSDSSDTSFSDSLAPSGAMYLCNATGYNSSWKQNEYDKCLYLQGGTKKNVCAYKETNKPNAYEDRYVFITSLTSASAWTKTYWTNWINNSRDKWVRSSEKLSGTSQVEDCSSIVLNCYLFSSKEKAEAYLRGEIDEKEAENYGDLINDKGDYDESLPYFDKAAIEPIDAKKYAMQFNAAMNSSRVKELYNLRDDGYQLYYTFEAYGVYMDSNIWTSISRIFETVGLSSSFTQKVKENITIDSSGRLVVGKAYSGGGGRHSGTLFKTISSNKCNVYAVELDETVTTASKLTAGQNYTKDLTAKIFNGGDAGNLLFGVNGSANLIGYYAIIQPYIIKDGTIIYAKPTYAYNWVYKSLRDSIGNGAYNYDPTTPDGPVDPVTPPSPGPSPDPDPDNPDPVDPIDPSSFDLVGYIKLCMKEAKSFILLFDMYLTAVPAAIWVLIIAAMTLNLIVIVFKIVRGM